MTSIKKLVGISSDPGKKIQDTLEARQFVATEVFSHGFPHHPTSLSYDVLQSLVAVGNDMGTIRLFGKAGLEVCLQHDPRAPIKQLVFITNKGYLVSVTNDDTLNLWELKQKPARLLQQLKLKQEKVTKCSYTYGSHWLYVGTDKSNVLLVRVEGLVLSAYNIPWNEVAVSQGGRRTRPGAVVDMLEHPLDQGKVLLGYTSGLMVLWNLATKQVECRYSHTETMTSLSWRGSGKEFAASFDSGSIGVWNVKSTGAPDRLFYPYDTSRGQRGSMNGQFSSIGKLQLMNVKGNPLFVFSGGTPKEYAAANIALLQGKSLSILLCDSPIVDFITIPSSPHLTAVQNPRLLVVLCQDGLSVFDIGQFGSPLFDVPFVLDLHKPAVTSVEYLDECPDNLTCSLQPKQTLNKKAWPFCGGQKSIAKLTTNLLITGHCDGHVKLWQTNSVSIQPAMTINTMESFTKASVAAKSSSPRSPSNIATKLAAITTNTSPSPLSQTVPAHSDVMSTDDDDDRKMWSSTTTPPDLTMNTVDDYVIVDLPSPAAKDDSSSKLASSEFFPVSHVILNPDDMTMCVVNIGLFVMLYSYQPAQTSTAIRSLTVRLESSSSVPSSPAKSTYAHNSPATDCGWSVLPESPSTSKGAGFHLMFCCQCVPMDKYQPQPVITCVEYSSKYGILVIGLTSGLIIVDTVNCKSLLVEVDEIEFMGFAQAKRKGWMNQISPAKEPATIDKISKKAKRKSEKLPPPSSTLTAAAAGTDFTQLQNTLGDGNSQLYVTTVRIADLTTDKQSLLPNGSIWVGSNNGNVIAMDVHAKSATKGQARNVELSPNGIYHRLHYPTVSMTFLDDTGNIITVPSQRHTRSTLSSTASSLAGSTTSATQYAVLCSEVLCKVYTLPDGGKSTMLDLVDKLKTSIVKTETCHIEGCPSLICITFNAEILVYSLPALRPVAVVPFTPLNDLRVLRTFHVATNGTSAVYMYSPSEVQRLSLLKHNESAFTDALPELHTSGIADSDRPSSRGVMGSLFGAGQPSMLNRDELFGEGAGRPPRDVAETRPGLSNQPRGGTAGSSNIMSHAREALSERGQKLGDIADNTARMKDSASAYEEAARETARKLREKYANRKWWQL